MQIRIDKSTPIRYGRAMNDNAPTKADIERLEGVYDLARGKQRDLESERSRLAHERVEAARRQIGADLDKRFKQPIADAREATQKAHRELQDAKIAVGRARLANMYQGVLVEWKRPRYHFEKYKPGKRGRLMVRDHDTQFPSNIENGLPEIGDVFIRHYVQSTGELGLRYTRIWGGKIPSDWLPEGETPIDSRNFDKSDAVQ
jgi:hypothetical protein